MKYLVIETCSELLHSPDRPTNWTIIGSAKTLEEARELVRDDAQTSWDGWEDKTTMTAERYFHPYLIVSPEQVLTISLEDQRKVIYRVRRLTVVWIGGGEEVRTGVGRERAWPGPTPLLKYSNIG